MEPKSVVRLRSSPNLLDKIDHLIIGGGMAYTFIKAQGGSIGNSLVEDDYLEHGTRKSLRLLKRENVSIHLPEDSVVADGFSNEAKRMGRLFRCDRRRMDGFRCRAKKALMDYSNVLAKSKTILWQWTCRRV